MQRSHIRRMTVGALVGAVVMLAALVWLLLVYPGEPGPGAGEPVSIRIQPDTELRALARRLAEQEIVAHPRVWMMYMRLHGADERLRSGEIVLGRGLTPAELLRRVATGYGAGHVRVAIPEGFTRFDIARRMERWGVCEKDAFIDATANAQLASALDVEATTLEGYLFPATYRLEQRMSPRSVTKKMVRTWRRRIRPLIERHEEQMNRFQDELGWGVHEVMTLASIVEKEAAQPEERPIIAGVFLNRLRSSAFQPSRLQADPTAAYGCLATDAPPPSCEGYAGGAATPEMVRDADNPYNTYRIEGLPPGPIANPGIGAVTAVLDPADHDYLYFVARGQGRHEFSTTLKEHVRAVDRHQRDGPVPDGGAAAKGGPQRDAGVSSAR